MGAAVAQWLVCCGTNRKVAGSNPDGVTGIFHWHNPSYRTMALRVDSASNRNEYQEDFLGVNAAGAYGWQPYHLPVQLSWNLGTLTSWNPLGHSRPVTGRLFIEHKTHYRSISKQNYSRWFKEIIPFSFEKLVSKLSKSVSKLQGLNAVKVGW